MMDGKTNIVLVGMPGSGKSTLGKIIAEDFAMDFLDIDDYMEEVAGRTVWSLLQELGEEGFMKYERDICLKIDVSRTVIATTGSVPLYPEAMDHLRKKWVSILLDIPLEGIKQRLARMKVDRIIGMANGRMALDEVLSRRKPFYDVSYDYVFPYPLNWTKEEVSIALKEFLIKNVL